MQRFVDEVAIVTGAGNGIGKATALRLGSEGAAVAFLASKDSGFITGHQLVIDGGQLTF